MRRYRLGTLSYGARVLSIIWMFGLVEACGWVGYGWIWLQGLGVHTLHTMSLVFVVAQLLSALVMRLGGVRVCARRDTLFTTKPFDASSA